VVGQAVSLEGEIVYSSDTVIVHVIPLSGVRIAIAVKRVVMGADMSLYLLATEE